MENQADSAGALYCTANCLIVFVLFSQLDTGPNTWRASGTNQIASATVHGCWVGAQFQINGTLLTSPCLEWNALWAFWVRRPILWHGVLYIIAVMRWFPYHSGKGQSVDLQYWTTTFIGTLWTCLVLVNLWIELGSKSVSYIVVSISDHLFGSNTEVAVYIRWPTPSLLWHSQTTPDCPQPWALPVGSHIQRYLAVHSRTTSSQQVLLYTLQWVWCVDSQKCEKPQTPYIILSCSNSVHIGSTVAQYRIQPFPVCHIYIQAHDIHNIHIHTYLVVTLSLTYIRGLVWEEGQLV